MNEKILQGKELAELLGIAPASVSISAKKDYLVKKKYPISEWANRDARGRIIDYRVPEKVYQELDQELDRSKNYEKKYDRETDEVKSWITMWNNRLDRIADADDKDGVMWIIDAMEETNKMMNVEQEFPDLWERFVSIRDQKFSN